MLGAILGDIAGSVYEWNNVKTKDFQPLVAQRAFFTGDTVFHRGGGGVLRHDGGTGSDDLGAVACGRQVLQVLHAVMGAA